MILLKQSCLNYEKRGELRMKEGIHQITINKQQLHVLVVMF